MNNQSLEQLMRDEWKTPFSLCEFLEMQPTSAQADMIESYLAGQRNFKNESEEVKGLCVILMWEVLSNPGRRLVITGSRGYREYVLGFMDKILCQNQDLKDFTRDKGLSIRIGNAPGWSVRAAAPNNFSSKYMSPGDILLVMDAKDNTDTMEHEANVKELGGDVVRAF